MEQYPNLPGFYVDLVDDGLQILPSVALTSSVTLIGTAETGPYFTPVKIGKPEDVDKIFGPYERDGIYNDASLVPAFRQAFGAGCRDISLVRIPHRHYATIVINEVVEVDQEIPKIIISSLVSDRSKTDDEDIKVEVTSNSIKIWNYHDVLEASAEPTHEITFTATTTYAQILKAINDRKYELNCFALLADGVLPSDVVNISILAPEVATYPAEAADTLFYEEGSYSDKDTETASLRGGLANAYNYLVDYETDIIVPVGFHLRVTGDIVDSTDAERLALFCEEANARDSRVVGVISLQPLNAADSISVSTLVSSLTEGSFANLYTGKNGDTGKYISITVGELLFFDNRLGSYASTAEAAYAGLISTLPPHSATTNKVIPNARGLRYTLYPAQLDALSQSRLVTFRNRLGKGTVVTDGITCAKPLSDFTRLSTLRIANSVINIVKQVTEPFIGEAMNSTRQDAVNTAVDSGLKGLQDAGAIRQYEFVTYFANMQDRVNGILSIALSVVPAFEIRKIKLKLTLKPTL